MSSDMENKMMDRKVQFVGNKNRKRNRIADQVTSAFFLVTTPHDIQFTTVSHLVNKTKSSLEKGWTTVVNLYSRRGFVVTICLADLEFSVIKEAMLAQGVMVNTCRPGEHVPTIKRKIRTIKERVRSLILTLPFDSIPEVILVQAVIFSVMWLNFFCPKGGVSTRMSPQTIMTGFSPDASKHCRMPFGGFAQIHAKPTPAQWCNGIKNC